MNYLCIDVEWNIPDDKTEDMELLSIGATCWDGEKQIRRTYSKLIKPDRMDLVTPTTYRLLNLGPVVLGAAKTCEEVLSNFVYTFQDRSYLTQDDSIVIWSREAWTRLKKKLDCAGLSLPSKRIVILQEVLSFADKDVSLARSIGFETALRHYNVDYRYELLHKSKYDSQYLADLYEIISERIIMAGDSKVPLVHTENSRVLHQSECHYVKNRSVYSGTWRLALTGWCLCQHCGKRGKLEIIRAPKSGLKKDRQPKRAEKNTTWAEEYYKSKAYIQKKSTSLNERAFANHCKNLGLSCQFSIGWVYLRTPVSYWKIQHDGLQVLSVLHESSRPNRKGEPGRSDGFHQQRIFNKDIYGAVNYIYEHDKHVLYPKYYPSYWRESEAVHEKIC